MGGLLKKLFVYMCIVLIFFLQNIYSADEIEASRRCDKQIIAASSEPLQKSAVELLVLSESPRKSLKYYQIPDKYRWCDACASLWCTCGEKNLIKYAVLHTPWEEYPNPCAWRTGLDTRTIASMYCVSKAWNKYCKEIIGIPRDTIIAKYSDLYINRVYVLFNKFASMAGFMTAENIKNFAVCAVIEVCGRLCTQSRGIEIDKSLYTCDISYVNELGCCVDDVVFIVNTCINPRKEFIVIVPTLKQSLLFRFSKSSYVGELKNQFCKVIQKVFANFDKVDKQKCNFWDYKCNHSWMQKKKFDADTVYIDINDPFFDDITDNLKIISSAKEFFNNKVCSCSENCLDDVCRERYEQVCAILEEENITTLKPEILQTFAQKHVLHKIVSHNDITIYVNPFGDIVKKDAQNILSAIPSTTNDTSLSGSYDNFVKRDAQNINKIKAHDLCYALDTLQVAAQDQGDRFSWRYCNNDTVCAWGVQQEQFILIGQKEKNEMTLGMYPVFVHGIQGTILDSAMIIFKNVPFIIAVLKDRDRDGELIADGALVYFFNTQCTASRSNYKRGCWGWRNDNGNMHDLQKIFKSILLSEKACSVAVSVSSKLATDFMRYIEKLPKSIDDIPQELARYKMEYLDCEYFGCDMEDYAEELGIIPAASIGGNFNFYKEGDIMCDMFIDFNNLSIVKGWFSIRIDPHETITRVWNAEAPFGGWGVNYYVFILKNGIDNRQRMILWKNWQFLQDKENNPTLRHVTVEPSVIPHFSCESFDELKRELGVFANSSNKQYEAVIQISDGVAKQTIDEIKGNYHMAQLLRAMKKHNADKDVQALCVDEVQQQVDTTMVSANSAVQVTNNVQPNVTDILSSEKVQPHMPIVSGATNFQASFHSLLSRIVTCFWYYTRGIFPFRLWY